LIALARKKWSDDGAPDSRVKRKKKNSTLPLFLLFCIVRCTKNGVKLSHSLLPVTRLTWEMKPNWRHFQTAVSTDVPILCGPTLLGFLFDLPAFKVRAVEPALAFLKLFECLQIMIDTDQKRAICPLR
jgi:hypothetical protein